ncbi:TldD/PmbA family protein [Alkalinema sp. FACHB-956]|uniref:TldD/PmbA family protein n=1 Tax=Alkalinema sp. FACHB-956 TaxID=2692768 RepID=UPI0016846B00|nr:TldD/PmbA family protein [Alkalinema sp. FACHB-956]MBD2326927.1 TldD/PmbA family protein [Alkalinema sp. FACHB-956]
MLPLPFPTCPSTIAPFTVDTVPHPAPDTFAEELLDLARKAGAEAAEVYRSESLAHPVSFEANRLKQLESSQADGTALRIWKEGRPGLAVAYGAADPQALVDRAIALSELNDPEDIELTERNGIPPQDLGDPVAVEQLITWGNAAIEQVRQAYPDVLCGGGWDCETETTRLINSLGLDCSYTDTTLSGYLEATLVRGDDFLTIYDGQALRQALDPALIASQVLQRLDWAQDNTEAPQGKVPVLLTAKAADMLWGTVQAALNGKQVLDKASPWSDRLGSQVLSEHLTLTQAPNQGPYSCPFDDEGTPTQELTLIQSGVLQNFYCDRKTGRALNLATTGNGFRPGLGSYPSPSLVNFLVEAGSTPLKDLIANIEDGLILDQILGGGGGLSGDFSINVDLGYCVKNGQIVGRVKDTMVAGNIYTALKQVLALGNDADWNGSCRTPSIVLGGLFVTERTSDV